MYWEALLLALLCAGGCYGEWWGHHHNHNHNHGFGDWGKNHHHGHGCRHHHDSHSPHDHQFEKLSSSVIDTDLYSQSSCKNYSNCNVLEIKDIIEFKLVYTLQDCDPNQITVQIKHRVIYMYAKRLNGDDTNNYYDVRILPKMLKAVDATWSYDGEKLTVLLPYDTTAKYNTNGEEPCLEVNENIISVPKSPQIIYKYGQS